jgi:TusA-related sulfurtransferase
MSHVMVDARQLFCPLPVIRVQDQVASLAPGTIVEAVCSDRGALHDIPSWCRLNGHRVIEAKAVDFEYIVVLEVAAL